MVVEIEEVFSSKPRMRILKLIYTLQQLNVSKIASKINMNYSATAEHLKLLENEGIAQRTMDRRQEILSTWNIPPY